MRDGQGILFWRDGVKYDGIFENDEPNGFGTKYAADGSIIHRGQWKNGEPV